MGEFPSDEFWLDDDGFDDDIIVQNKTKNYPKKTKKQIEKVISGEDDNKCRAIVRLLELTVPKSAQTLLIKLIINGQLTFVDKILLRKKKSIILSGKANQTHRNFPLLNSDDVIIKILINGNKTELWKRTFDECNQQRHIEDSGNRPTMLLRSGNIIIMSMIGTDGKPAPTLKQIVQSNQRNIATVYDEVVQYWCRVRDITFHPSNILYHDGKWWTVGHAEHDPGSHLLLFYRKNLKSLIDFFCHYGLSKKQAEDGFMKYGKSYYWDTQQVMRGMTRKRSFFSIMYS